MIINTERLILKKIEPNDLNELIINLNNWNVAKWMVNVPYPYKIHDAKNWLDKSFKDDLTLNIYLKNNLIGGITIDERPNSKNNYLGYWIGENYWGNGYAIEASRSLISYFFSNHSIKKIYASHIKNNEKSKKILLKLGFNKISTGKVFSISKQIEVENINYELIKS